MGSLKFGATQEQVKEYLGDPDKVNVDGDAGDRNVIWVYDIIDGFVAFDEEDDFRFCDIETSSPQAIFEGLALIGWTIDAVEQAVHELELGAVEKRYSTYEEEGDERCCLSFCT